jgi:methionyl-tRNA formyltransferase
MEQRAREPGWTGSVGPRVIFFGTPAFAMTCLDALFEVAEVALVVTQPDRGAGRGLKVSALPVKKLAEQRGVPVLQPAKVRTAEFAQTLQAVGADIGVVVAYGRILPLGVLQAPRLGCVNIHASLLPKLRGAAPIEWAIINGETETGVCLMQLDEGMDTGPVFARSQCAIEPEETAAELSEKLALLGARLLASHLERLVRGELVADPQDHWRATKAPILRKEDGQIIWDRPARSIHNLVRGVNPWPGAFTWFSGKRILVHRARVAKEAGITGEAAGTVIRVDAAAIEVGCSEGVLALEELQLEGKKKMAATQLAIGQRIKPGMRFTTAQ